MIDTLLISMFLYYVFEEKNLTDLGRFVLFALCIWSTLLILAIVNFILGI